MTGNAVLILDNEEVVLETIEMFYPSDDVSLFTASSLEKGGFILEQEKPSVVVSNSHLKEASGRELITKLREKDENIEIVFMSDIDIFKDTLAEFGGEISDVVYKPVDMDILEMTIKRAQERYANKRIIETFQQEKDKIQDENSNLNTQIIELSSKLGNMEKDNFALEKRLSEFESKVVKEAQSVSDKEGRKVQDLERLTFSLQKNIEEQKKISASRMDLVISILNALRKSSSKDSLQDIFLLFEEALVATLKVEGAKISIIDSNDKKRVTELENILKSDQLALEAGSMVEIPFKAGTSLCSIRIFGKVNINNYNQLLYLFKELLSVLYFYNISNDRHLKQLETEKKRTTAISSIFANLQMYLRKSQAIEKMKDTKLNLSTVAEEILNLVLAVQNEVNKLEGIEPSVLQSINDNLTKIITEKAQNFDIIGQKLAQVNELVTNIQLGLSGQRMKQISGDRYLFSKDRKQI